MYLSTGLINLLTTLPYILFQPEMFLPAVQYGKVKEGNERYKYLSS